MGNLWEQFETLYQQCDYVTKVVKIFVHYQMAENFFQNLDSDSLLEVS